MLYINITPSIVKTFEVIKERFSNSNILDPIKIWGCSTLFIGLFGLLLGLVLPERQFHLIAKIRRISVTIGILYVIYITLILSALRFIGITLKKVEGILYLYKVLIIYTCILYTYI